MRLRLCRCRVVRFCITVDIVRDGGRRNVGVRTCAVWPLPRNPSRASAQPSAATASAIISSGRDGSVASAAASSVQPSAASSAGACRSRASITATSTSSRCNSADYIDYGLCYGLALVRDRVANGRSTRWQQSTRLRGYSTHTHWCSALVRQRLGGVGGNAPVHAQRTPAQQSANRPWPREDARAA